MELDEDIDLFVKVGKRMIKLNRNFLDRQKAWDNLDRIKSLHRQKLTVMSIMDKLEDPARLKAHAKVITEIEYDLQEAWGFKKDIKWHRFWELPKCACAKMDNSDAYPTGYYTFSGACPIHRVEVVDV